MNTLWDLLVDKLGFNPQPSPQQKAVWDIMAEGRESVKTIRFTAFNKSIVTDFEYKWGWAITALQKVGITLSFATMHSMGFGAVGKSFKLRGGRDSVNEYRVANIIEEITGINSREMRRTKPLLLKATEDLVGLCKMNLVGFNDEIDWNEALDQLARHYDVDVNHSQHEVFPLVQKVLERCKDVNRDGQIDYGDMIWLPVVMKLSVFKYDLLLCDEVQDFNRCQQALAKMAGKRLIMCGDPKQAIYGFAGADAESMNRMYVELQGEKTINDNGDIVIEGWKSRGCIILPLTVTRRCGKAIVAEAQKIVPEFEAHESNPEGKISYAIYSDKHRRNVTCQTCKGTGKFARECNDGDGHADVFEDMCDNCNGIGTVPLTTYHSQVQDGDFLLCRVNAPLVSECFKFIRAGRKAVIQGRDVGQGLISTVKKLMKAYTPPSVIQKPPIVDPETNLPLPEVFPEILEFVARLSDWRHQEIAKENAKRNPSESRIIGIGDKHDCLMCFTEGAKSIEDVIRKIESIFTDNKESPGIRLSSVHKAKGLESSRVFILEPQGATMPHPMARGKWQVDSEWCIRYVALTRAIDELIFVS